MVGGGPGSFIGDAHRRAINLDGHGGRWWRAASPERLRSASETGAELGIAAGPLLRFVR